MRKGTGSLQISPRRLLSLLLFQLIAAFAVQQVHGSRSSSRFVPTSNENWYTDTLTDGVLFVKKHMMVSRCSSRYVQLKPGKNINAKGNRRSLYAVLKFESDPSGAGYVRIQGDTSNRYLCFSKKARLIARSIGDSDQCLFKEEYHGHFVKLQSVVQPQWYVGFNSRGRKLYGYEHDFPRRRDRFGRKFRRRRHQNCFMFTKVDVHRRRRNRSRRHFRGRSLEVSKRRRTFKSSKNR